MNDTERIPFGDAFNMATVKRADKSKPKSRIRLKLEY